MVKAGRGAALAALAVLAVGCVRERERRAPLPRAHLEALTPAVTAAGQPFQVQPDGASAISVTGANLFRGCRVLLGGEPLETTGGGDAHSLSAIVPGRLFARPAELAVTVEMPDGQVSNALAFTVLPSSGPAPTIAALHPDSSPAGRPFNVQRNGQAALAVTGSGFLPGAKIVFGGVELETVFSARDRLGAFVPGVLIGTPREVDVAVRNPDGKRSPAARFTITKGN